MSQTSHISKILEALCGDAGIGGARKALLVKRLQTSLEETHYSALDEVFSGIFGLPRLESESYSQNESDLLSIEEMDEMDSKDAAYRARIRCYMESFIYGGTVKGIELAAQAATGIPCQVIDSKLLYGAAGISSGDSSGLAICVDSSGKVDGESYVVVPMTREALTQEQLMSLSNVTSRIRPACSKMEIKTLGEIEDIFAFSGVEDEVFSASSVEESSHWWGIDRYVTGRSDWDYEKYPDGWVEPDVRKKAPKSVYNDCQEEFFDLTYLATNFVASSEHAGVYGYQHSVAYPWLDADNVHSADCVASSTAYLKWLASYYGGSSTIDWSYPAEYVAELQGYFSQDAQAQRSWSSDERGGNETVSFSLGRIIPVTSLSFSLSAKPIKAIPYASSDGGETWVRIANADGFDLAFTSASWGVSVPYIAVEFEFPVIQADSFKIEFQRLDVPWYEDLGNGAKRQVDFPWSIEVRELSVGYTVSSEDGFAESVYNDPFGNLVETKLHKYAASNMLSGGIWRSQPNIGSDSCEYLIFDLRDSNGDGRVLNYLDIDCVQGGCQLNLYSSDNGVSWKPYPDWYFLTGGRISIPTRKVSYLKMEFTSFASIPYEAGVGHQVVNTLRFPYEERQYWNNITTATWRQSEPSQLFLVGDVGETFGSDIGVTEYYQTQSSGFDEEMAAGTAPYAVSAFTGDSYRNTQSTQVRAVYGDEMSTERSLAYSSKSTDYPQSEDVIRMRFHVEGEHVYEVKPYERTMNLAYMVSLRNVDFGFSYALSSISDDAMMLRVADGKCTESINGWDSNGERLTVSTDEHLCSFETLPMQSVIPFRTFRFASKQSPARQIMEYPSDMSKEWTAIHGSAVASDFGVSGTVLKCISDSNGIEIDSNAKLVKTPAIAQANVDVFCRTAATWTFECRDLFGEVAFSMPFDVPAAKWTTLGCYFTPMPGGSWWNADYSYRIGVPVAGALAKGQNVFIPQINETMMTALGITLKEIRLVWFNGVECEEIPMDRTGDGEYWFRVQQNLPSGVSADGSWHQDIGEFIGSYHIYFGSVDAQDNAKRNIADVFSSAVHSNTGSQQTSGVDFTTAGQAVDLVDDIILGDEGFVSLEMTPDTDFVQVPAGTEGKAERRWILEYADDDKRIDAYTYEKQLVFKVADADGFESTFVSQRTDLFAANTNVKMLFEWGKKGTAEIVSGDGDSKERRDLKVFVGSATQLVCIPNVYDEHKYDTGSY